MLTFTWKAPLPFSRYYLLHTDKRELIILMPTWTTSDQMSLGSYQVQMRICSIQNQQPSDNFWTLAERNTNQTRCCVKWAACEHDGRSVALTLDWWWSAWKRFCFLVKDWHASALMAELETAKLPSAWPPRSSASRHTGPFHWLCGGVTAPRHGFRDAQVRIGTFNCFWNH